MSESDFYTVNHRYEAQGAPLEWPTWEVRAHGSAAPAVESATSYDPAGSGGPGCPPPRLDPLGPWCSARLTFADGARIDVLVTVSDEHLTVEDVRADPPLTLAGLAALARWIEGPLDDTFRAATGRPQKARSAPRQPGPAAVPAAGDGAGGTLPAGPDAGSAAGAAPRPASGPRPLSPHQPAPLQQPVDALLPDRAPDPVGAGAGEGPAPAVREAVAPPETPAVATGTVTGDDVADPTTTGAGCLTGVSADTPSDASSDTSDASSDTVAASPAGAPAGPAPTPSAAASSTPAPAVSTPPAEPARSAVLSRSRSGERRRIAADAYRQAQQEGHDPVLAVMLATGRNRRRSLRLIAGARDKGLLTPRHNKR
ncbi:DUF6214 family protein [Streptomyces sp. NBC_01456]|uniref:DUF6214 family protein n=1 Tax=unclassified Streptomyces TaxID=2593676 RepID=UPI003FCCAE9A